ncbi:hypothetical protein JRO89_XS04G0097000 [Xanthoceras sorbifolium]|uniref:Uncharacterized protein n=1 Tax=Xanthoceras sorbifolium TaxID=99658 RepID=A0ABQ8I580_9ROSI|nr:hypothetical protein JRO89_XS04G0097000 [Xanthoceras sorbifolium]
MLGHMFKECPPDEDSSTSGLHDFNFGFWMRATSLQRSAGHKVRKEIAQSQSRDNSMPIPTSHIPTSHTAPHQKTTVGDIRRVNMNVKHVDGDIRKVSTVGLGNVSHTLRKTLFPEQNNEQSQSLNVGNVTGLSNHVYQVSENLNVELLKKNVELEIKKNEGIMETPTVLKHPANQSSIQER